MRGFSAGVLRIVYESSYLGIAIERHVDLMSNIQGDVEAMIQTIMQYAGEESTAHVTQDQATWLDVGRLCNGGALPLDLDEIDEVILLYTPVIGRSLAVGKAGLGEELGDWENLVMVLTCGLVPGTRVEEGKQDYGGKLELKSFYCLQLDLGAFHEESCHEELWQCPATPGDCKVGRNQDSEKAELYFVRSETALQVVFGNTDTMNMWLSALHWYTEEGLKEWEYEVVAEEEDTGKKKKGKK